MTKLSMEDRVLRESQARVFDETIGDIRQFIALRAAFPALPEKELAHRMVTTVKQIRKYKRLLERGI